MNLYDEEGCRGLAGNAEADIAAGSGSTLIPGTLPSLVCIFVDGGPVLKPRTAELYDGLLRNHLLPSFGNLHSATSASRSAPLA